ncbi:MAG: GPW/gp25 family protein [Bacteroidota bacterium]
MMLNEDKTFLGRGWSFPPIFDEKSTTVRMVEEEEDISQSILLLLSTRPGERIMQPDYGCELHNLVFDKINADLVGKIEDFIATSILYYEPRVTLEKIDIDPSDELNGLLNISLQYLIRKTNVRTNIVYPYYFIEGTNIREVA